jgi:hypothetical protein
MPRVSYQAMLGDDDERRRAGGGYAPLGEEAIATRRRDAKRELTVLLSKEQVRWLREVEELAGQGIDASAVVRALVDLGRELDVDWTILARGPELRRAVRESVLVRRDGGG